MLNKEEIHEYFVRQREPRYADPVNRSEFLAEFMKDVPKDCKIVEIGCNLGRNLNYLYSIGYKNLTGVEISPNAVELMNELYDVKWKVINKPIEDCIKSLDADCYITMACLEHLHPESEWIFDEMKKAKYIITIEDEIHDTDKHCARNYGDIFKGQVAEYRFKDSVVLDPSFVARLFVSGDKAEKVKKAGKPKVKKVK